MIGVKTATSTDTGLEPAQLEPEKTVARAVGEALAAQQIRHAAGRWLTSDRITPLGQQLVLSIDRCSTAARAATDLG